MINNDSVEDEWCEMVIGVGLGGGSGRRGG